MDMQSRWSSLWWSMGGGGDPGAAFKDLKERYAEPHRAYHTLKHIEQCLEELDEVPGFYWSHVNRDTIECALWFHDAIYNPRGNDNEEQSADLANRVLRLANIRSINPAEVVLFILSTEHLKDLREMGPQLIADIDLSILGRPEEEYEEYSIAIRSEYAFAPWATFSAKRGSILHNFLLQALDNRLFHNPHFRNKYNEQAKRNLKSELRMLQYTGYVSSVAGK